MLQCDPHEEGRLESLQNPLNVPVVDKLKVVSFGKFIDGQWWKLSIIIQYKHFCLSTVAQFWISFVLCVYGCHQNHVSAIT